MCIWTSLQVCLCWPLSSGPEANLVALTYCVSVDSTEQPQGCQLDFCWLELSWRMRPRRPSTLQPLIAVITQCWWISSQRWSKAKPFRHLEWTDDQLLLCRSAPIAPQCFQQWVRAPTHFVWEAQFLLSGIASLLSMPASLNLLDSTF